MMKRNYFGKFLAIAMIFAGFSLVSCDENDNAIINGQVWVKPEVKLVDGGAIITGSSTADINRMLGRVREEIMQAANDGEKFTIDIQTPVLNSTAGDNTLTITAAQGGDVVLNLPNNIVTEVPLMIQALGVADDALPALSTNEVEINIPSGASNIDLGINMPTSTVTLKGGTIDNLAAKTAINTLVIESGVTVNWLKMLGGRALVKDGGKVLGYLRDGDEKKYNNYDTYVYSDGVEPVFGDYGPDVYFIKDEAEEPYFAQNLKIVKGKAALANVLIRNGLTENPLEMYIDDGAAVSLYLDTEYDSKAEKWVEPNVKFIQGLGNKSAKIYPQDFYQYTTDKKGNPVYRGNISFSGVKELKNVIVDDTARPEYYDSESGEYKDLEIRKGSIYYLPSINTDCDFISPEYISGNIRNNEFTKVTNCTLTCPTEQKTYDADGYYTYSQISNINAINSKVTALEISSISPSSESSNFKGRSMSFTNHYVSGNSATIKSCKFETADEYNYASISLPYQTKDRSEFNFTFDTCQFGKGFWFSVYYDSEMPWFDKDGKLITKAYFWWVLNDDGTVKTDPMTQKRSVDEKDIPAANKANGKYDDYDHYVEGVGWVYSDGYWYKESPDGFSDDAFYKDYKGIITFEKTTLGGKAITKDTEFISDVRSGYDEKDEIATTTRFVLDGKSYKAVKDSDTQKWTLIEAE
jgi:hypothetical protein